MHVTAMSVKMIAQVTFNDDGCLLGELDCIYFEEPFTFSNLMSMIEMMETTFDTKGFPEKHLLPRTFGKAKQRFRKHELDLNAHAKENADIKTPQKTEGKSCTFEISVKFRHNAEWQGNIYWVEKDVTKPFSSIIELLKLMDDALNNEQPDNNDTLNNEQPDNNDAFNNEQRDSNDSFNNEQPDNT